MLLCCRNSAEATEQFDAAVWRCRLRLPRTAHCAVRRAGEKPTALFREAGLDPKLIGYKRIERAFARWRYMDRTPTSRETSKALPAFKPVAPVSDQRDKLISEQALRIQQLEEEISKLKRA